MYQDSACQDNIREIGFCKSITCCLFVSLVVLCQLSIGCNLFESRKKPVIEEAPPYYQADELSRMRSFHEKDRENTANQVHIVRNKELEKLNREIEEQKKDKEWEEDYQRTLERREKLSFWKKFKSGGDKTYMMSDEAKRIHNNLER